MTDGIIIEIIISPDYDVGLWTVDGDGDTLGVDLDSDYLPFSTPEDLQVRFDRWVQDYWRTLYKPEQFDWDEYDARGRQLAQEIKNLAGKDMPVTFRPCRESIDSFVALPEEVMKFTGPY